MKGKLLRKYCNPLITARRHTAQNPFSLRQLNQPKEPVIAPSPYDHHKLNKEILKRNNSVLS